MVHSRIRNQAKKIDYEQLINSATSTILSYISIKIQRIKEFMENIILDFVNSLIQ